MLNGVRSVFKSDAGPIVQGGMRVIRRKAWKAKGVNCNVRKKRTMSFVIIRGECKLIPGGSRGGTRKNWLEMQCGGFV